MSTAPQLEAALQAVPKVLRTRLLERYTSLKSAFVNAQYDACGLRAGRFAEVMLRVLQDQLTGTHTPLGTKLGAFDQECAALERTPKNAGSESLRIIAPRALNFVYTLRNKRGIGHEGGDVDANEIDALTAVRIADWCLSELIRVTSALPLEDAQELLDAIAERTAPQVWAVGGVKRVLDSSLSASDQVLLLAYSERDTAIPAEDLFAWVEYNRLDNFRSRVLAPLHRSRLVEFDRETQTVVLSPTGAAHVEQTILPKLGVAPVPST